MLNQCNRNGKLKWKVMVGAMLALMLTLALTACSEQEKQDTTNGNTPPQSEQQNIPVTGSTPTESEQKNTSSSGNTLPQSDKQSTSGTMDNAALQGEDLVIPVANITEKASFYPIEVDGTQMEVLAVKAPDGTIRTAFNTCQVCYDSGRGYYKQVDDMLVCQNCGNQFPMNRVEVESGGCNPWPVFSENKIVTDESITISHDFLNQSKEIFANWKSSY